MITLSTAVLVASVSVSAVDRADTESVSKAYVQANFVERNLERAGALFAPDAFFIDPTGEVFGGPLATGIRGRDAIVALQKSWGVAESTFAIDFEFVAGEYAVFAGSFGFKGTAGQAVPGFPFATILRVGEKGVTERHDYGNYSQLAPNAPVDPKLKPAVDVYLDTYFGRRFDALGKLHAEDVVFQDPTAVQLGAGQLFKGRAAVRANLERSLAGSLAFEFEPEFKLYFGRHAVQAGTCRFAFPGASFGLSVERVDFELPLLVTLELKDGLVVDHRDYADYDLFVEHLARLKRAEAETGK